MGSLVPLPQRMPILQGRFQKNPPLEIVPPQLLQPLLGGQQQSLGREGP